MCSYMISSPKTKFSRQFFVSVFVSNTVIKSNAMHAMKMVRLQASYNNLTEERDQIQTSYNQQVTALTKERNDLQRKIEGNQRMQMQLLNAIADAELYCINI